MQLLAAKQSNEDIKEGDKNIFFSGKIKRRNKKENQQ